MSQTQNFNQKLALKRQYIMRHFKSPVMWLFSKLCKKQIDNLIYDVAQTGWAIGYEAEKQNG